jgi:hypothetical protein
MMSETSPNFLIRGGISGPILSTTAARLDASNPLSHVDLILHGIKGKPRTKKRSNRGEQPGG